MPQNNAIPQSDIILTAIQSLDVSKSHNPDDFTRAVIARSITISKMLNDRSLAVRALDSVRIYSDIKSIEFEESSQRYVIKFRAYNNNDGDEDEIIRSPRMDSYDGKILKPVIQTAINDVSKSGHCRCIIYKNNEQVSDDDKKKAGKNKIPASGYRNFVWIEFLR